MTSKHWEMDAACSEETLHIHAKQRIQKLEASRINYAINMIRHVRHVDILSKISHARTVVRECCKGDDESQRERGKFDPPPPKNPLTDGHQNLCRYVGDIYHHAKFYPNRFRGFGSAHA